MASWGNGTVGGESLLQTWPQNPTELIPGVYLAGLVVTQLFIQGGCGYLARRGLVLPATLTFNECFMGNSRQEGAYGWTGVNLLLSAPPWGQRFQKKTHLKLKY